MADLKLDMAFWNYDRTRALTSGDVKITGVAPTFHTAPIITEIFEAMIAGRKFGVSKLGMTYFLRMLGRTGWRPKKSAHPSWKRVQAPFSEA